MAQWWSTSLPRRGSRVRSPSRALLDNKKDFPGLGSPFLLSKKCDALLEAYGKQEGRAFNFHYQSNGYHPLVCYDGITGDLIKIQLRDGTRYSCTGVVDFLQPILDEYLVDEVDDITRENNVDYAVVYGEFMYQTASWPYERRVVYKVEKPENQMTYIYTFIVTNMDSS